MSLSIRVAVERGGSVVKVKMPIAKPGWYVTADGSREVQITMAHDNYRSWWKVVGERPVGSEDQFRAEQAVGITNPGSTMTPKEKIIMAFKAQAEKTEEKPVATAKFKGKGPAPKLKAVAPAEKPAKKAKSPATDTEETAGVRAARNAQSIKMLVKDNPYREGSNRHSRFELLKSAHTVGEYLEAGGKSKDIKKNIEAGLISVSE